MLQFQLYSHVTTSFFFREDEAISLFFKNSSMSCKKLNNIWYCSYFGNPEHHRKRFIWISSTNNFQKIVTVTKVFVKQLQFFWVSLFSYGMCFSLFHLSGPNVFLLSAIWLPHSQLWATVKGSLTNLRLISVLLVSTRRSQGAL